jgi:hypothetical protein
MKTNVEMTNLFNEAGDNANALNTILTTIHNNECELPRFKDEDEKQDFCLYIIDTTNSDILCSDWSTMTKSFRTDSNKNPDTMSYQQLNKNTSYKIIRF